MPTIRTSRRKSVVGSASRRNSAVAVAADAPAPARVGPARAAKTRGAAAATAPPPAATAAPARNKRAIPATTPAAPMKKRKKAPRPVARPPPVVNAISSQPLDVYTFGTGGSGELGLGADVPVPGDAESVILLKRPLRNPVLAMAAGGDGGDPVVQVSAGGMHCAAVTAAGRVVTWGVNDTGALGRRTDVGGGEDDEDNEFGLNKLESTPTEIPPPRFGPAPAPRFAQVAATDSATFALAEDGNVWGWGTFRNQNGIFGFLKSSLVDKPNPTDGDRIQLTPVRIPGLPANKVTSLSAGSDHVLALTSAGEVYAWGGSGAHGELGRRLGSARGNARYECLAPQRVVLPRATQPGGGGGRHRARAVFAGRHHGFALTTAGALVAWGANNYAQAGVAPPSAAELARAGEEPAVVTPRAVPRLDGRDDASSAVHVAGGSHHSVACARDGSVLFWGRCEDGQAGMDAAALPAVDVEVDAAGGVRSVRVPTVVPGITAVRVAAGTDCTFAVTAGGLVHAWGYSDGYRTGLGTDDTVDRPKQISKDANKAPLTTSVFKTVEPGGQFAVITAQSA
ncbi:hypothetical protein RB599_001874 [Gaeumannomyces hyphopodioides]